MNNRRYLISVIVVIEVLMFIMLVIMPLAICSLFQRFNDNYEHQENVYLDPVKIPAKIKVLRTETNKVEKIDTEDYIKGVVACEMPSSFHEEALKAQAVAARTYAVAAIIDSENYGNPEAHPRAPLCDTTHCQVYKDDVKIDDKVKTAVDDTEGQLLYYKGKLVKQALFHSSSGGFTENSEDVFAAAVPYLVSVESPYEEKATHKNEKTALSIRDFSAKIKACYPDMDFGNITADSIKIIERSDGNSVSKIRIGNEVLSGRQVREALGLASANFTVKADDKSITFTSNGSGHGVGMSQYGADGMAREGYDYKKILSHYYSGTDIY